MPPEKVNAFTGGDIPDLYGAVCTPCGELPAVRAEFYNSDAFGMAFENIDFTTVRGIA